MCVFLRYVLWSSLSHIPIKSRGPIEKMSHLKPIYLECIIRLCYVGPCIRREESIIPYLWGTLKPCNVEVSTRTYKLIVSQLHNLSLERDHHLVALAILCRRYRSTCSWFMDHFGLNSQHNCGGGGGGHLLWYVSLGCPVLIYWHSALI